MPDSHAAASIMRLANEVETVSSSQLHWDYARVHVTACEQPCCRRDDVARRLVLSRRDNSYEMRAES